MSMKITITKETIKRKGRSSEPNPFDSVVLVCLDELSKSPADNRGSEVRKVTDVADPKKAINALRRAAAAANVTALTEPVSNDSFKFQIVDKQTRKAKAA